MNFWPSLLRQKVRFSNGFFVVLQNVFLKYFFFKLVEELLKSIVTTNQSSPISLESKSKNFWPSLLRRKVRFSNGFFVVLQNLLLKYIFFKVVKELFNSFVTTNQSSPISLGSKSKRIFDLACLGKKLDFQTVFSLFCKMYLYNIFFQASQGVVQIFCYYESKFPYITGIQDKKKIWPSLLRKEVRLSNSVFVVLQNVFLKYIFFKLVKELFKSIVTTNQNSLISLGSKSKWIFDLACLGKNLDFQTVFSLFCKMYFWNIFFSS